MKKSRDKLYAEWAEKYEKYAKQFRDFTAWDTEHIEYYTREIKRINEKIAKERKGDRDHVKRVWAQGVLTRWEMERYGNPATFQSYALQDLLKERRNAYRQRNHYRDQLEHDKARAEEYRKDAEYWRKAEKGAQA